MLFLLLIASIPLCSFTTKYDNRIALTVKYEEASKGYGPSHRAPLKHIYVCQNGNTLLMEDCIGCMVSIMDGDDMLFSSLVDANGIVEIPSTLVGNFQIHLLRGGKVYQGNFSVQEGHEERFS